METPHFWSTKGNQIWADLFLDHSSFTQGTSANFNIEFYNLIQGLCLCVVAKVCYLDCWYIPSLRAYDYNLSMLNTQIKAAMESLNSFQLTLDHLVSARDTVEMIMKLGKPLSGVKCCWLEIVEFYSIKSVWFYEVGCFLFLMLIV